MLYRKKLHKAEILNMLFFRLQMLLKMERVTLVCGRIVGVIAKKYGDTNFAGQCLDLQLNIQYLYLN